MIIEENLFYINQNIPQSEYEVICVDTETVKAKIQMYINDIIRVVILNVTMDITAYTEEEA